MRPINRCVMFTLTVVLFASDPSPHDCFSSAAACTADVVGIRYSKELARMIFRSASVHLKIPTNIRVSVVWIRSVRPNRPSNSYHPTDHHHNEVLITSTRVSRGCLQDSHVNGAGPPLNFPGVPRDPEPPNTTARPGHSSPAISAILDDKRNGREKGQRPCS